MSLVQDRKCNMPNRTVFALTPINGNYCAFAAYVPHPALTCAFPGCPALSCLALLSPPGSGRRLLDQYRAMGAQLLTAEAADAPAVVIPRRRALAAFLPGQSFGRNGASLDTLPAVLAFFLDDIGLGDACVIPQ